MEVVIAASQKSLEESTARGKVSNLDHMFLPKNPDPTKDVEGVKN